MPLVCSCFLSLFRKGSPWLFTIRPMSTKNATVAKKPKTWTTEKKKSAAVGDLITHCQPGRKGKEEV